MRLHVHWETTYAYSQPVRLFHTELRVAPAARFGQQVRRLTLETEPPTRVASHEDAFGNTVHYFDVLGRVEEVHVAMRAEVETVDDPIPGPELAPLESHLLVAPTLRCPFDPAIGAFGAEAPGPDEPLELAWRLMGLMTERFEYEVGRTDVEDTALDLLNLGHGVCQDFAHLMLAALRMHGVPARYVSGYLAGEDGSLEGDASHAWVQFWSDGAWFGVDPANHGRQDERYVVTAVGRDYDDVAPIRGAFRGSAVENWHAVVRVQSEESQQ